MDLPRNLDAEIEEIRRIETELFAKGDEVLDHVKDVARAIIERVRRARHEHAHQPVAR